MEIGFAVKQTNQGGEAKESTQESIRSPLKTFLVLASSLIPKTNKMQKLEHQILSSI